MKRAMLLLFSMLILSGARGDTLIQPIPGNWGIHAGGPGSHGISVIDFDQDGDKDLYITSFFTESQTRNFNQLFVNLGTHRYKNLSPLKNIELPEEQTHDAVWIDYDRDGELDLFVASTLGRHHLFRQSRGEFNDVSKSARINERLDTQARGVAAGDVNGDGWPDIFIVNNGTPNQLFMNDGQGHFRDEAESRGVADPRPLPVPPSSRGIGQGVTMVDFDDDGDLDVFVCVRDMNPRLFINDGTGRFQEQSVARGIHIIEGCDGATFGDLNGDGALDLVTARSNNLLLRIFYQTPQHRFTDMSETLQLEGLAYTPVLADINLDGSPDILLARSDRRLQIYLNDGDGSFELMGEELFVGYDPRGAVVADLDDDGDFDLIVVHKRDDHRLYTIHASSHWVKLKLIPPKAQSDLYGVKIRVYDRMHQLQYVTQVSSSYGYLSHAPPDEVLFGDPDNDFRIVDIEYPDHPVREFMVLPDRMNLIPLMIPDFEQPEIPHIDTFGCRRGRFLCP